ncbi:MAG TPA: FAD-dependent oxidoreductase, partial [Candidatus Binatia bacterium]|nr:FAD-dependent oxidoreductase [Candidatus Binatia bacterium]
MEHARAVVIGGGVGGTSVAYHLAERGWTEVILVERAELTSGSTFHSAGLVGQLRSSVTLTKMMMYGVELYRRLRDETGTDPSWHEVGSLRLASTSARYEELQRQAGWAKTFGLPLELIGPAEAQALFPLMSTDGVLGAIFLPTDGWLDPSGLAFALAAGARRRGVSIRTKTRVVGIGTERGRVTGVEVERDGERSTIAADVVVDAGGMFAPEIARMVGVTVPIIPMAHQYLFTNAIEGVTSGLPTMRDPDRLCYFREEVGGLCMGGYERDPMPWSLDGVLGAVWLPTDGWLDPSGLAQALAAGARARGASIRQHTRVVGIGVERGRVTGVEVESKGGERSTIEAEVVVNAGGMFAAEVGRMAGVRVPIVPFAHEYLVTQPFRDRAAAGA